MTLKTQPNDLSVSDFIKAVEHKTRRGDAHVILEIMTRITGEKPRMWGDTMVGFGSYHYKYASGREGDWFLTGFSPRKAAMSIYIMPGHGMFDDYLARLGKHKRGKSCLYINKLDDVDLVVLEELIDKSVAWMRKKYSG